MDGESQHTLANGGRLERWQDRPGFTYLAALTENYSHLGVRHRRAVLFLKPHYWLIYDRLVPVEHHGKIHDYRWQGHFQPMTLTVDPASKTVATSAVDGKRLYVIPARPESLGLEEGKGLIADGVHTMEKAVEGPYVRYIVKSDKPASFTVLLCPTTKNAPAPILSSLEVRPGKAGVGAENATGLHVRRANQEDILAIADSPGLRDYGPLTTDGEAAYVRTEQGKLVEVGLVGGQRLVYRGTTLLEVGPQVESANVHYAQDTITADVRGHGKIAVATTTEKALVLNGKVVSPTKHGPAGKGRWEVEMRHPGRLELVAPALSTDATAVYKALVGFRPGPALPPWNPVVVSWKTSVPSDATVKYAPEGSEAWIQNTKPDAITEHRLVLNRLTPGTTYRIHIRSVSEDGRVGEATLTHRCLVQP